MLAAAAGGDLWAAKAAALHFFRNRDFERAHALMRDVDEREASPENARNVAVVLRSLGRAGEAVEWVERRREQFAPIEFHDLLCSLLVRLGRVPEAIAHGEQSLRLKDAARRRSIRPPHRPALRCRPKKPERDRLLGLGDDPRYLNGAITNAIVARYLYPGWTARFYTDAAMRGPSATPWPSMRRGVLVAIFRRTASACSGGSSSRMTEWRPLPGPRCRLRHQRQGTVGGRGLAGAGKRFT